MPKRRGDVQQELPKRRDVVLNSRNYLEEDVLYSMNSRTKELLLYSSIP
jgi:hypothetical protein